MARKASRFVYYSSVLPPIHRVVSRWHDAWLTPKHTIYWRYLRNPWSRRRFKAQQPVLSEAQQKLAEQLRLRGLAITGFQELGVDPELGDRLQRLVGDFVSAVKVMFGQGDADDALEAARLGSLEHNQERIRRYRTPAARADDYLIKLYPEDHRHQWENPLLQLGVSAPVLDVVNSYLGLWAKLIYADVWHTNPMPSDSRVGSQRWHRDREDKRMVKVYLYCSTHDEASGPLQYVAGSQVGGAYQELWKWQASDGAFRYPADGELERAIPSSEWVTCLGPKGTFVFCDTSGLHRGGITEAGSRIVATWTYVTPASLFQRRFSVAEEPGEYSLSREARFAIR
jgi:hypothetical protein